VIAASFIERKPGTGCSAICEVKGTVRNHNAGLATFQIGGLTVIYDNATLINDMPVPPGSNWNGIFVEVKGTGYDAATTTLTATKVEPENEGIGNVVDEFEVEGFVTQAGTPNGNIIDFTIGTTPVRTTANTEFRGGTVDEIVVGAKMSAEGRFDGTTLIAKHVKFHASVRLEGDATVSGNTLTLSGLPGVTITANSQTELKDAASLNDLNGNHVRVRGRVTGPNTVIATRIELRSSDSDVDLQGPVQSISGTVIEILGVSVDLSAINQFESVSGTSMSRTAFLAEVQVNSLVKVKGAWNGTTVNWDEAELED
jgi:cytoskeletal protein CcmA (bactofilin family)